MTRAGRWGVVLGAAIAGLGGLFALLQAVGWGVTWLTGSERAALVIDVVVLLTLLAAVMIWLGTPPGIRAVQALLRVLHRLDGRRR